MFCSNLTWQEVYLEIKFQRLDFHLACTWKSDLAVTWLNDVETES